jgi:hypothetical protein
VVQVVLLDAKVVVGEKGVFFHKMLFMRKAIEEKEKTVELNLLRTWSHV